MEGFVVQKHKRCTLERIEKFISDVYFTDGNLRGRSDGHCVSQVTSIFVISDQRLEFQQTLSAKSTCDKFEAPLQPWQNFLR